MKCSINIGHFEVNSLSNNANIDFQSTYQNSHTANSTIIGSNFNFGDNSSISSKTIIRFNGLSKLFTEKSSN
jgi:hypothetical protein